MDLLSFPRVSMVFGCRWRTSASQRRKVATSSDRNASRPGEARRERQQLAGHERHPGHRNRPRRSGSGSAPVVQNHRSSGARATALM